MEKAAYQVMGCAVMVAQRSRVIIAQVWGIIKEYGDGVWSME
jgi:hypothetical protein